MIQHVKDNWVWYMIAVGLALIIIWVLAKYIRSAPPPQDTFYYKVIDSAGTESCNHDSGIRPSKTPEGETIQLQVLKKEYNDGKSVELCFPQTIKLGLHYNDLRWTLSPTKVEDAGLYYIVDITAPKTLLYGTNVISHIDTRKEVQ